MNIRFSMPNDMDFQLRVSISSADYTNFVILLPLLKLLFAFLVLCHQLLNNIFQLCISPIILKKKSSTPACVSSKAGMTSPTVRSMSVPPIIRKHFLSFGIGWRLLVN